MTPVPIDLPLRPSEAASLASLIYEQVSERKLSDDVRTRLAGRAATLGLKTVTPYFGSLEADPIHPATYYIAVDGLAGEKPAQLLLHLTPASSPASAHFPKALLIGRMRPSAGREIVMNAITFGPDDTAAVSAYATVISRSFMPRAHGALPLIWVDTGGAPLAAVEVLLAFRSLLRATGVNIAGVRSTAGMKAFWPMVWAAIRAGYRDGYSLAGPYEKESAKWLSCFRVNRDEAVGAFHTLRSARSGVPFDLELDLREGGGLEDVELLRSAGVIPQFILGAEGSGQHGTGIHGAGIHGAMTSIEVSGSSIEQLQAARGRVHGPCAVTVHWDGRQPAAALLLDALR